MNKVKGNMYPFVGWTHNPIKAMRCPHQCIYSWGSFTQSLGKQDLIILDKEIRNIVREISGIELRDVDLSRK